MKQNKFLSILIGLLLIIILYILVFPMEDPGMLQVWHGVQPSAVFHASILKFTFLELVLSSLLFLSIVYSVSSTKPPVFRNNFRFLILMFCLCIVWGYIGTFMIGRGIDLAQLGIAKWKKMFYGFVLFYCLSLYVDSEKKVFNILNALIISVLMLDIYGLVRYLFFGGLTMHGIGKVVFWETSKFELNVFVFVCMLGFLLLDQHKLSARLKACYGVTLPLVLAVIFMSSRRTSMVLVLLSTGIYLLIATKRGHVFKVFFLLLFGTIAVLLVGTFNYNVLKSKFISRLESIQVVFHPESLKNENLSASNASTKEHLNEFTVGWETIRREPIWGVGYTFETAKTMHGTHYVEERFWFHNEFLTFWMRFGIMGAITYIFAYATILIVLYKSYKCYDDIIILILLIWFLDKFLVGLFFPPFIASFKKSTLFFAPLAIGNAYINILRLNVKIINETSKLAAE